MAFEVLIKKTALKFIESLDRKRKMALKEAIGFLKNEPVPAGTSDIIKLEGYDSAILG